MAYLQKSAIPVSQGGTGATTFTAYAPICAGTTATGALQSAATGLSTSGNVLVSNGASTLPSWQSAPGVQTINGDSGSVTGTTITITGGTSGAIFTGSSSTLTESFNFLSLPSTTSTNGQILINGTAAFHAFGTDNIFAGSGSGNFSLTGSNNVGLGASSLASLTNGADNTCLGYNSGEAITSATNNVCIGSLCGTGLTSGSNNVAVGYEALGNGSNTSSSQCVSIGYQSLNGYTGNGPNTVVGYQSMNSLTSGTNNVALGDSTGTGYTGSETSNILIGSGVAGTASESNVLRIGNGTGSSTGQLNASYIAGIQGITVTGSAVLVSSSDQLGVAVSSARFKEKIEDIVDESSKILQLRPVTFTYKEGSDKSTQTGLIAEEVAQILPNLVILDKEGLPLTVKYSELPVLILNEMKKALSRIEDLENKISIKNNQ